MYICTTVAGGCSRALPIAVDVEVAVERLSYVLGEGGLLRVTELEVHDPRPQLRSPLPE